MKLKKIIIIVVIAVAVVVGAVIAVDAWQIRGIALTTTIAGHFEATLRGQQYEVIYVPKKNISPFFGEAREEFGNKLALVRNDLPKSAQIFVMHHELFHLQDSYNKKPLWREIHANLAAIPYSPIGFLQVVYLSLTDPGRLNYYLKFLRSQL